ncbi:MAG TPA: alanine racemase [Stellaceae bacterium]|nr:alanine racemase [Stellaceae bacterium]
MACDPAERAGAILEIDLEGVAANWRALAARVAPAQCAAVVKADAYGLGAVPVAAALAKAGCRRFFVATLDEGIALRRVLAPANEIAVFNGPPPQTAAEFAAHDLIPVLNDPAQIEAWQRFAADAPAAGAILHLDTGMARLGLTPREFAAFADAGWRRGAIRWRGLMSHLACADEPGHALNALQHSRFAAARDRLAALGFSAPASLAASSGIFLGREYHFDFVRPGAALYGVNPHPPAPNPMRQVLRLKGKIVQVREIDRGESVGYGASHIMETRGRLATVAIGYADGWPRSLSHRGGGRLGGAHIPLVGRVSMDLVVFDVSALPEEIARPGAFVDLLDAEYGVDRAAADAGTIGYEILTALGRRYHRAYRGESG